MSDVDEEDAESVPSRPSQVEGDEDDVPDTDPAVYTLKDVRDEELDMSDCVQKILEGLRGDAFCIARDIGLDRLLQYDGIDHLVEETRKQAFPLQTLSAACVSPGMPMQDTDPEDGEEELLPDVGMDPPLIGGGDDGGGALTPEGGRDSFLSSFLFLALQPQKLRGEPRGEHCHSESEWQSEGSTGPLATSQTWFCSKS